MSTPLLILPPPPPISQQQFERERSPSVVAIGETRKAWETPEQQAMLRDDNPAYVAQNEAIRAREQANREPIHLAEGVYQLQQPPTLSSSSSSSSSRPIPPTFAQVAGKQDLLRASERRQQNVGLEHVALGSISTTLTINDDAEMVESASPNEIIDRKLDFASSVKDEATRPSSMDVSTLTHAIENNHKLAGDLASAMAKTQKRLKRSDSELNVEETLTKQQQAMLRWDLLATNLIQKQDQITHDHQQLHSYNNQLLILQDTLDGLTDQIKATSGNLQRGTQFKLENEQKLQAQQKELVKINAEIQVQQQQIQTAMTELRNRQSEYNQISEQYQKQAVEMDSLRQRILDTKDRWTKSLSTATATIENELVTEQQQAEGAKTALEELQKKFTAKRSETLDAYKQLSGIAEQLQSRLNLRGLLGGKLEVEITINNLVNNFNTQLTTMKNADLTTINQTLTTFQQSIDVVIQGAGLAPIRFEGILAFQQKFQFAMKVHHEQKLILEANLLELQTITNPAMIGMITQQLKDQLLRATGVISANMQEIKNSSSSLQTEVTNIAGLALVGTDTVTKLQGALDGLRKVRNSNESSAVLTDATKEVAKMESAMRGHQEWNQQLRQRLSAINVAFNNAVTPADVATAFQSFGVKLPDYMKMMLDHGMKNYQEQVAKEMTSNFTDLKKQIADLNVHLSKVSSDVQQKLTFTAAPSPSPSPTLPPSTQTAPLQIPKTPTPMEGITLTASAAPSPSPPPPPPSTVTIPQGQPSMNSFRAGMDFAEWLKATSEINAKLLNLSKTIPVHVDIPIVDAHILPSSPTAVVASSNPYPYKSSTTKTKKKRRTKKRQSPPTKTRIVYCCVPCPPRQRRKRQTACEPTYCYDKLQKRRKTSNQDDCF
jgi:hypothetical protein